MFSVKRVSCSRSKLLKCTPLPVLQQRMVLCEEGGDDLDQVATVQRNLDGFRKVSREDTMAMIDHSSYR